eukprot:g33933.t1
MPLSTTINNAARAEWEAEEPLAVGSNPSGRIQKRWVAGGVNTTIQKRLGVNVDPARAVVGSTQNEAARSLLGL